MTYQEMCYETKIKITIVWYETPCFMVVKYQRVGGTSCFHLQAEEHNPQIQTESISNMLLIIYQTTRC
jgi:hypothetical protein